jgi:hypothetical protein
MFRIARFASIQNNKFLKGHVPYCKIRQHIKVHVLSALSGWFCGRNMKCHLMLG